jgi:hypothetical protein
MFDIWPGASDLDLPAACLRKSKRLTSPTKSREDQWTQWTQWTPHGMGSLRRPSLFTVEAKGPIGSDRVRRVRRVMWWGLWWCDEICYDHLWSFVIICDLLPIIRGLNFSMLQLLWKSLRGPFEQRRTSPGRFTICFQWFQHVSAMENTFGCQTLRS